MNNVSLQSNGRMVVFSFHGTDRWFLLAPLWGNCAFPLSSEPTAARMGWTEWSPGPRRSCHSFTFSIPIFLNFILTLFSARIPHFHSEHFFAHIQGAVGVQMGTDEPTSSLFSRLWVLCAHSPRLHPGPSNTSFRMTMGTGGNSVHPFTTSSESWVHVVSLSPALHPPSCANFPNFPPGGGGGLVFGDPFMRLFS